MFEFSFNWSFLLYFLNPECTFPQFPAISSFQVGEQAVLQTRRHCENMTAGPPLLSYRCLNLASDPRIPPQDWDTLRFPTWFVGVCCYCSAELIYVDFYLPSHWHQPGHCQKASRVSTLCKQARVSNPCDCWWFSRRSKPFLLDHVILYGHTVGGPWNSWSLQIMSQCLYFKNVISVANPSNTKTQEGKNGKGFIHRWCGSRGSGKICRRAMKARIWFYKSIRVDDLGCYIISLF